MNDHQTPRPDTLIGDNQEDDKVVAELEKLDDLIYPAIDGDEQALAAAVPAWENAVAILGKEILQESKNQYLRHAMATWNFLRSQTIDRPHRLLAVAKILILLTGDDVT